MEGVDVHVDLTSIRNRAPQCCPLQHQSHLSRVPPHSPQMCWGMPKRKGKKPNLSSPHTALLNELGFLGQRTNLVSKAQPFQRIMPQKFNFKLIRKAEIKPRIIFVPQRVCKGGLKTDCRNPIEHPSIFYKSRGFQHSNKLNEQSSVNQVSPHTCSCVWGSTTSTNDTD